MNPEGQRRSLSPDLPEEGLREPSRQQGPSAQPGPPRRLPQPPPPMLVLPRVSTVGRAAASASRLLSQLPPPRSALSYRTQSCAAREAGLLQEPSADLTSSAAGQAVSSSAAGTGQTVRQ